MYSVGVEQIVIKCIGYATMWVLATTGIRPLVTVAYKTRPNVLAV